MKIIKFLKLLLLLFMLVTMSSLQNFKEKEPTKLNETKNKNVLFIAIDDLKPLLSNYGHKEMKTPNFDRLAKMGTTFTKAYVQYAICGASRASVMTGVNPDNTKVWGLKTDFRESAPNLISMPEYLVSKGYQTAAVGKIYHESSVSKGHDYKSWSVPYKNPENFNVNFKKPALNIYQNKETRSLINKLKKEARVKGIKNKNLRKYVLSRIKPSTEKENVPDDSYLDGVYTKAAIQLLQEFNKKKPWFLAVGFKKPHLPFVAPKKYWDLYNRDSIKIATYRNKALNTPSFAFHNFGELTSYSDIDKMLKYGDELPVAKQVELIHGYMACVSYIDAQIGLLLDELEKKDHLKNTIIVLWGDHGFHLGDHKLWCKHSNFEQATKIPFMFAGPGVKQNQKLNTPVNLIDLFPTLFDLVGVEQHSQTDGKSLLPLLDNNPNTQISMDYAYHQYKRQGVNYMGYSIRTDRYRYTEWLDFNLSKTKKFSNAKIYGRELYDYKTDPLESKNLVFDRRYEDIAKKIRLKLQYHLKEKN